MNDEPDLYHPASDFLMLVLDEEVPLSGSPEGDSNLALLIDFTRDADRSNRDWATLLLAQTGFDTPEIRAAFIDRIADENDYVRGEALAGLAQLDRALALPLVLDSLNRASVPMQVVEAAGYVADATLLPALRDLSGEPGDAWFESELEQAIRACETGEPTM